MKFETDNFLFITNANVSICSGWGKFCSKKCKAIHQPKIYNGVYYTSKQPHEDVVYEYDY